MTVLNRRYSPVLATRAQKQGIQIPECRLEYGIDIDFGCDLRKYYLLITMQYSCLDAIYHITLKELVALYWVAMQLEHLKNIEDLNCLRLPFTLERIKISKIEIFVE